MSTYQDAINDVKNRYGFIAQPCWIAHVKELNGVPTRKVWNRAGTRKKPCPSAKRPFLETSMRALGMIP